MTTIRHVAILITWLTLFFCASSSMAAGKGLFYAVHSKTATAYLMGSVHVGSDDFYPLPQQVDKSFAESGLLVLEVDPAAMTNPAMLQKMLSSAVYPAGDSLRNHVTPATYELAMKEAGAIGLPGELLAQLRPWVLGLTLQIIYFQKQGYSAENGIESYFIRKGEGRMPVEELESADFQIKLLSGFNEKEQEIFLLDTLRNLSDSSMLEAMMQAWREGNAQALETVLMQPLREHPEILPIYDKLIFSRNRAMATKIEQLLKGKKRPFVVVGAGHLVGKDGVVELLRRKGYRVEQQ